MELHRGDGSVIALEIVGEHEATPVLFCHGLADSRLSANWLRKPAAELGLRVIAPDRPGTGGTDQRRLRRLADWAEEARLILDALQVEAAVVLGVSGGGSYAAACAARIPDRVRSLMLVSPLGLPGWPTRGMATGERLSLEVARRAPGFGGWFLGRLDALARRSPRQFLRLAKTAMPDIDRRALEHDDVRESFLTSYAEAFRRGTWGVAQDLRVLARPWGFDLGSIKAPTVIHHGDADLTVPLLHSQLFARAIPGARLKVHPGDGHFSILSAGSDLLAALPV
jgi:pimeloyl-ACP methyl ester carboxylesterase